MPYQNYRILNTRWLGRFGATVTNYTGQRHMLTHSNVHSVIVKLQTLCVQIWSHQYDQANRDEATDGRSDRLLTLVQRLHWEARQDVNNTILLQLPAHLYVNNIFTLKLAAHQYIHNKITLQLAAHQSVQNKITLQLTAHNYVIIYLQFS
jgi:hypothetical protein